MAGSHADAVAEGRLGSGEGGAAAEASSSHIRFQFAGHDDDDGDNGSVDERVAPSHLRLAPELYTIESHSELSEAEQHPQPPRRQRGRGREDGTLVIHPAATGPTETRRSVVSFADEPPATTTAAATATSSTARRLPVAAARPLRRRLRHRRRQGGD